ncbi:MAG TPA: type II secretion system F family protein [Propionibacteriaceae bacterium]|nr:type II secretion system F family protein [Propionibacteriaceae bacterium]
MLTTLMAGAVLAAATGFLIFAVFAGPSPAKVRAMENLRRGTRPGPAQAGGAHPAATPAKTRKTSSLSSTLVPKGSRARLDRMLARAGRPADWPLERVVTVKVALTVASPILAVMFILKAPSPLVAVLGVLFAVVLYVVPELRLYSIGIERREKITLELADTLDQMSIAVEAGLGFDAAMVRVAKNGSGVLAAELIRTLQDIQVGQTRRAAYEDLVERTQVPDLKQFIRSIIQAEAYGLALSSVLNTQAAEMRMKRRQRAEAKAMQIPVKVIFPLMLCILPVLFMVVMGPGVIGIIAAFSH